VALLLDAVPSNNLAVPSRFPHTEYVHD
jgi:hypothetical protein